MLYLTDPDPRGSMGLGGKTVYGLGSLGDFLTAIDYRTGKVAWRHQFPGGGGGGLLATAGGLVFSGDGSGNFAAFDAANGKPLWHSRINNISNAPQTYSGGRTSARAGRSRRHALRVHAASIRSTTMRYTRRDFGKLALTAMPAVAVLRPSLAALAQAPAKPNSTINGVDLGTITYSYRSMPDQSAEAILRYVLDSGISRIEFMGGPVEAFAGAPPIRRLPRRRPWRTATNARTAGGPARSGGEAARVANVGVDGSFQGAAEDVQRRRRHDLRVEAAQPEHVRRRDGVRLQRRRSARLHAHDARNSSTNPNHCGASGNSRRRRRSTRRITRTCRAA